MILKYVLASFIADKVAKNEKVKKGLDKAFSLGARGAEKISHTTFGDKSEWIRTNCFIEKEVEA